jgi:DNA-binding NtrC family response regulator
VLSEEEAPILVVDDDEDVRTAAVALFESCGYAAIPAKNGRVAMNLLESGTVRPCLILLDLWMPDMDGWQFRAAQLCDKQLAGIPVVVVSAAGRSDVEAAADSMRAAAGIPKPFDSDELLRLVDEHCRPPTFH